MAESVSSSSSHGGQHQLPVKLNQEYRVKLGRTFTFPKENAFHTIKYDFKPKSVDESKPGRMKVSGDEVSVSLPVTQAESESDVVLFKGAKRTCTKECILIINTITGEAILEKISNTVQLKGVRDIKKKKHPRSVSPIPSQIKSLKVSSTKQAETSSPSTGKKAKRLKKSSPSSATVPPPPPPPVTTSTAPPVSSKSQNISSSNTSSKSLNPPPSSSSSFLALPDSISPLRSNNPTPEPPPLFASQPKRKKGLPSSNSSSSSSSSDSSSSSGSDSETEFVTVPTLSSAPPPQMSLSSMPQFTTSSVIQQPIPTAVGGGGGPMGYQVLAPQHGSGLSQGSNNNGVPPTAGGSLSDTSSSSSSEGEDDSSSSDSEKDAPVPSQHQTLTNPTGVDIRQRSMSVLKRDLEMSESDSD